jgi:hypothetical protein
MFKKKYAIIAALLLNLAPAYADENKVSLSNQADNRISLGFTAEEKAIFYTEMQQMLSSIQGILVGIGEEDREKIIEAAKRSGNIMPRNMAESIQTKTPTEFKRLGGPTHMLFEELAIRAEDDDMISLAAFTGEIMNNCMACHAMFKVD